MAGGRTPGCIRSAALRTVPHLQRPCRPTRRDVHRRAAARQGWQRAGLRQQAAALEGQPATSVVVAAVLRRTRGMAGGGERCGGGMHAPLLAARRLAAAALQAGTCAPAAHRLAAVVHPVARFILPAQSSAGLWRVCRDVSRAVERRRQHRDPGRQQDVLTVEVAIVDAGGGHGVQIGWRGGGGGGRGNGGRSRRRRRRHQQPRRQHQRTRGIHAEQLQGRGAAARGKGAFIRGAWRGRRLLPAGSYCASGGGWQVVEQLGSGNP